ncbi:Zn-dependent amino-or carboxypeptidase, M28 family [Natronorubrum sediminis]|uniref:Carboxypeptidase Q n=1 Tax=Natronorubrum sediminis TaxID=640943 RepID=A0A1H6FTR9_9EURY|nr:M28 family peptidase [Natronorubrum sediminis]SEH13558.1 Zn-dependent amino-or carboxypeptidase, M28 family [Natronorubrum sediminis]
MDSQTSPDRAFGNAPMMLSNNGIGDAYASEIRWRLFERLTDIGSRMPASDGERRGAQILEDHFDEHGLTDVSTTEFSVPSWSRGTSSLVLSNPVDRTFAGEHEVLALPGSPAETVTGEIIDVGAGLPEHFESKPVDGNIALVSSQNPAEYGRAINRIEKYVLAENAGATGFVYYNDVPGSIAPTGTVGFGRNGPGKIPAVGITREVSRRIKRWLDRGTVSVTLSVDADIGRGTSRNVEAVLGPEGDEEVLLTSHVDAHDIGDGARDNAAGCALAAEVGRLLATVSELGCPVRVVCFGSEEIGLYGSTQWANDNDLDRINCQVNLDGIGFSRSLMVTGTNPVVDPFVTASDELGVPIRTETKMSPFNDAWPFAREGVPVATCRSAPKQSDRVVRYGHEEWGHTHADTADKLDKRDLRDLSIQIAEGVATATRVVDGERLTPAETVTHLPSGTGRYFELSNREDGL